MSFIILYFKPALAVLYLIMVELKSVYRLWPPGVAAVFFTQLLAVSAQKRRTLSLAVGGWGQTALRMLRRSFFGSRLKSVRSAERTFP